MLSRSYPNRVLERLGLWVKRLVVHCAEANEIKVISPSPYCPPLYGFSEYTRFRRLARHDSENGVEVFYPRFIVGPGRSLYYTEAISYYLGIRRQADALKKSFDFNIIHAHFTYPDGVAAALLGQRYGVPVVTTEHAPWHPNWMDKSAIVRRQAVWAARASTFQIAVSRSVRDTIVHFTGEPEKVRVIPCGVDGAAFTSLNNGKRPDPNQILYVGFINFNKGIDTLLKAMLQVTDHQPEAKLVIVGGSFFHNTRLQEQRLRCMAHDLGLDNHVEFVGPQSPDEVARYMRESALLVLPSHAESFGTVLVEALASGTPVVATRCGGPEDIVNERVGLLIPKGNVDALASAIDRVLRRRAEYDPATLRSYALANFSWERVAHRVTDLYAEAIGRFQAGKKGAMSLAINDQP